MIFSSKSARSSLDKMVSYIFLSMALSIDNDFMCFLNFEDCCYIRLCYLLNPELTAYSMWRSSMLVAEEGDIESVILPTESSSDFNLGLFNNEFYPIYP